MLFSNLKTYKYNLILKIELKKMNTNSWVNDAFINPPKNNSNIAIRIKKKKSRNKLRHDQHFTKLSLNFHPKYVFKFHLSNGYCHHFIKFQIKVKKPSKKMSRSLKFY